MTFALGRRIRDLTPKAEFALVALICFGLPIARSTYHLFFPILPRMTTARTLAALATELALGGIAGAVLAVRGWRRVDFRLRLSGENILVGGLVGLGYIGFSSLASGLLVWIVPALRPSPARHLVHSAPHFLLILFFIVNSLFEEGFVNAYTVRALERMDARHPVFWSAALRASYHTYQGLLGPLLIFAIGLVLAATFARRRDLGIPVVAHTVMNTLISLLFSR